MKKIRWHVVGHDGSKIYGENGLSTRNLAREYKACIDKEIFEEWNSDISYPLHIEREEWELVSKKVVR